MRITDIMETNLATMAAKRHNLDIAQASTEAVIAEMDDPNCRYTVDAATVLALANDVRLQATVAATKELNKWMRTICPDAYLDNVVSDHCIEIIIQTPHGQNEMAASAAVADTLGVILATLFSNVIVSVVGVHHTARLGMRERMLGQWMSAYTTEPVSMLNAMKAGMVR